MKKIISFILLIAIASFAFVFVSCSEKKDERLKMPEDTGLEYWLSDKIASDFVDTHEEIPDWFGVEQYYGKDYHSITLNSGYKGDPEYFVKYLIGGYPDVKDEHLYVRGIDICDPDINIYGFRIGMSADEFYEIFLANGYEKVKYGPTVPCVTNGIITASLTDYVLSLSVEVTNVDGITY